MQHNNHHLPMTENGEPLPPNTGPVCKARLDRIPTALVGPAQKSRSPQPLLLPGVSAGLAVPPPAATAEPPAAAAEDPPAQPKVTRPVEPEEPAPAQESGAAVPLPSAGAEESAAPLVLDLPTPTLHTVPFASLSSHPWWIRHPRLWLAGIGAGSLVVMLVVVLLGVLFLPAVTAGATVTLVPASTTLSSSLTITATTQGTPDPSRQEVEARLLSVNSPLRTQTVQTTGTGHAPARAAQGVLTLYNAAPYQQTVPPGTVLVGADGVEIVTDAPAVIPAGNPPVFGVMTVLAHAVDTGPQGNIAPLDLNGLCCVAGVSVKNSAAFTGGQDAYDYPAVTQHDVEQVAGPLLAPLTQQTQASIQAQVRPNEQLLGFVQCQPTISPDHPVGSAASQVTVRVSVACRAQVYNQQATEQLVTGQLTQQVATTLGSGYALVGQVHVTISQATIPNAKPGTLLLLASGEGTWAYQFSPAELARLNKRLAGLSRQEALHVVQQQEAGHLRTVNIQVTGWWSNGMTLPTDPARVHLLVAMGMEAEQGGR